MSDDPRGRAYDARDPLDFPPPRQASGGIVPDGLGPEAPDLPGEFRIPRSDDPPLHDPDAFAGECRCLSCRSRRAEERDRAARTCPITRIVPWALARGDDLYDAEGRLIAVISYGAEAMEKIRPWLERVIHLSPPSSPIDIAQLNGPKGNEGYLKAAIRQLQPDANKDAAMQPARPTQETD